MVVLKRYFFKKIAASSLTEVLIATVIIVLIFGIALTSLHNIMQSTINNRIQAIDTELTKLQYLYKNGLLTIPFSDEIDHWNISAQKIKDNTNSYILFEAKNTVTNKHLIKKEITIEFQ